MSSNRVAPSFDGLHEVEDHVEGNDTGAGAINVLITKQNTGSTASEKGSDSENDGARNDAAAGKRRSSYQHTNVDRDMFRIESEEEEQDNDWGRPSCSQRVGGCCVTLNQRVTYGLAQSGRVCKVSSTIVEEVESDISFKALFLIRRFVFRIIAVWRGCWERSSIYVTGFSFCLSLFRYTCTLGRC